MRERRQSCAAVRHQTIDKTPFHVLVLRPLQVIPNVKLQIAATFCISNLIWNVEEGAAERQNKLREMGVYKLLQNLMTTTDTGLFDK